jgi:hypothetical protein
LLFTFLRKSLTLKSPYYHLFFIIVTNSIVKNYHSLKPTNQLDNYFVLTNTIHHHTNQDLKIFSNINNKMFSLTHFIVLLFCTLGSVVLAFDGDLTYYQPGLGSCGETSSDSDRVVALAPGQFESTPDACGKMIQITKGDLNATAKVVDKCPVCTLGSIDVSSTVFQEIAPLSAGRVQITWEYM